MWAVAQGGSVCTFSSGGSMLLAWTSRLLLYGQLDCVASSRHGVCRSMSCPRRSNHSTPSFYSETTSDSLVLLSECERHSACGPVGRSPVLAFWPRSLIPTAAVLRRSIELITERTSRGALCLD